MTTVNVCKGQGCGYSGDMLQKGKTCPNCGAMFKAESVGISNDLGGNPDSVSAPPAMAKSDDDLDDAVGQDLDGDDEKENTTKVTDKDVAIAKASVKMPNGIPGRPQPQPSPPPPQAGNQAQGDGDGDEDDKPQAQQGQQQGPPQQQRAQGNAPPNQPQQQQQAAPAKKPVPPQFQKGIEAGSGIPEAANQDISDGGNEGGSDGVDNDDGGAEATVKEKGLKKSGLSLWLAKAGGEASDDENPMAEINKEANEGAEEGGDDENKDEDDEDAEKSFREIYNDFVQPWFKQNALQKAMGPFIGPHGGKWADPQHKIPYDEKKHAGKSAPAAKEHDEGLAEDLHLTTMNDSRHHRQMEAVRSNLVNKMAAGTYDHAKATKLMAHVVKNSANTYHKDTGVKPDAATKMATAKKMADQFADEAKHGEHDRLLNKKNSTKVAKHKIDNDQGNAYTAGGVGGASGKAAEAKHASPTASSGGAGPSQKTALANATSSRAKNLSAGAVSSADHETAGAEHSKAAGQHAAAAAAWEGSDPGMRAHHQGKMDEHMKTANEHFGKMGGGGSSGGADHSAKLDKVVEAGQTVRRSSNKKGNAMRGASDSSMEGRHKANVAFATEHAQNPKADIGKTKSGKPIGLAHDYSTYSPDEKKEAIDRHREAFSALHTSTNNPKTGYRDAPSEGVQAAMKQHENRIMGKSMSTSRGVPMNELKKGGVAAWLKSNLGTGVEDSGAGKAHSAIEEGDPSLEPGEGVNGPMLSLDGEGGMNAEPGPGKPGNVATTSQGSFQGNAETLSDDDPSMGGMPSGAPRMRSGKTPNGGAGNMGTGSIDDGSTGGSLQGPGGDGGGDGAMRTDVRATRESAGGGGGSSFATGSFPTSPGSDPTGHNGPVSPADISKSNGVGFSGDAYDIQLAHNEQVRRDAIVNRNPTVHGFGVGNPTPQGQRPQAQQPRVVVKGMVVYSDAADIASAELAKGEGFFQNGAGPSLGGGAAVLHKSQGCPTCGSNIPAWLSTCPRCGVGITEGHFQKALQKSGAPQVQQNGQQPLVGKIVGGPKTILRTRRSPIVNAAGGIKLDE